MNLFWFIAVLLLVIYPFGIVVSTTYNVVATFLKVERSVFIGRFKSICKSATSNGLVWPITICIIGFGFLCYVLSLIVDIIERRGIL